MKSFSENDLKNKGYHENNGVWEPIGKIVKDIKTVIDSTPQGVIDEINKTGTIVISAHKRINESISDTFWRDIKYSHLEFIFNITPNTKPRQTISDKWNKRKCVVQYRAFADLLRSQAAMLNFKLISPLIVEFHVPMATSWGKARRIEMDGKPHTQTPDVDNFCKSTMDALLGQDNIISEIHARKFWSTEGKIIIYQ